MQSIEFIYIENYYSIYTTTTKSKLKDIRYRVSFFAVFTFVKLKIILKIIELYCQIAYSLYYYVDKEIYKNYNYDINK